jgi:glycosyltransferase involved in cell wall biosynthesis
MRIIAAHLLNDYSGSPKVLMQLLKGWVKKDFTVELYTCSQRDGFLSELEGVSYSFFKYKWAANPIVRLINLLISQFYLCRGILKTAKKEDIVYVNTVLPFGAALAGKIKGCRVIYHLHETSVKPAILKSFLFGMVKYCAQEVIYVSEYLASQEPFNNMRSHVLHNAIDDVFLKEAQLCAKANQGLNNILMVCSLKEYKGVDEFLRLATLLPTKAFKLVLNASKQEIDAFFNERIIPENVIILPTQSNVHPFYQWADLTLNLSNIDRWVETFGLTIIEGMAYGNPAIVPPIGGVTEIVKEGQNGALINSKNIEEISYRIAVWSSDLSYFEELRKAARDTIALFNEETFISKNIKIINTTK